MLAFVLRCTRVPIRLGKIVRHAIRSHWGLSHHAAHAVYHAGLGTMLVCTAVPVGLWLMPPAPPSTGPDTAPTLSPPPDINPLPGGEGTAGPLPGGEGIGGFLPLPQDFERPQYDSGPLTRFANEEAQALGFSAQPAANHSATILNHTLSPAASPRPEAVGEPSSLLLLATGIVAIGGVRVMCRRTARGQPR